MQNLPEVLDPLTSRVLLIGWDAADWKIIDDLIGSAEMPNLQRLIQRGVQGDMRTIAPVFSPVLWTSIATGKRSFKHGIHGFAEPAPGGVGVQPISNLSRKTKAIWNILHQAGKRSQVVGWWPSHPAEPIRGVMVSDQFRSFHKSLEEGWPLPANAVHPPEFANKLEPYRIHTQDLTVPQLAYFVPKIAEIDYNKDKRLEALGRIIAETSTIQAVATALLQLEPWDFAAVYFDGLDHFGHGFMKYHPPRQPGISERDAELYGDVIRAAYRFFDLMLGTLMGIAGEETTIILMSDHGFHSDHLRPTAMPSTPGGPAAEHREHGICVMAGPGIARGGRRIQGLKILDICPTILTLFGLPIGMDMDGSPAFSAFERAATGRSIPSWDEVPGECGAHPPDAILDPVQAEESLKQLVALGYIEALGDNQEENRRRALNELQFSKAISYLDAGYPGPAASLFSTLWSDAAHADSRYAIGLIHALLALKQPAKAREMFGEMLNRKVAGAKAAQRELYELLCRLKSRSPEPETPSLAELRKLTGEIDWKSADEGTIARVTRLESEIGINTAALLMLEAQLSEHEGAVDRALQCLARIEETDEAISLPLRRKRGELYLRLRRNEEALAQFEKALAASPQDAGSHLGKARASLRLRRLEDAIDAALSAVEFDDSQPLAHLVLGIALYQSGQINEGRRALEMAVAINPNLAVAHRHLARIWAQEGQADQARQHLVLSRRAQARRRDFSQLAESPVSGNEINPDNSPASDLSSQPLRRSLPAAPEEIITIVSGLPRSGTSMMMQVLSACGVPVLADNHRVPDSDNPRGYFELEEAKSLRGNSAWLRNAQGKAVKIVAQLLPYLPEEYCYRVILMARDLSEVIDSQRAMLERLDREGARLPSSALFNVYHQQLNRIKTWLAMQRRVSTIIVHYDEALARPAETISEVAQFLDREVDAAKVAAVIDSKLRRQRSGR